MCAVPVVQVLLVVVACFGLWRLCRTQPRIVVAGFLVRALLGQALFWISYLRLPVARSLQTGNGFWFFAVDGPYYLKYATKLVGLGPAAIFLQADEYPSSFFVQVLSFCVAAFGGVASVAILLNCAAYLLTCAILVRVARPRNNVVLAAIAFSPASILFSLQPLKDTLFMLLIVAMVAAFRRWEELWRAGSRLAQFLGYGLVMCAVIYALAGIRWYFSLIACGAAAIFFVLTSLQSRRKGWAFAANALLLILLAQSIRLGAPDLPPSHERLLNPMTALQWRPSETQHHIAVVKHGFDSTPGATTIAEGKALAQPDVAPAVASVEQAPSKPAPPIVPAPVVAAASKTAPPIVPAPVVPAPSKPAPSIVPAPVVAASSKPAPSIESVPVVATPSKPAPSIEPAPVVATPSKPAPSIEPVPVVATPSKPAPPIEPVPVVAAPSKPAPPIEPAPVVPVPSKPASPIVPAPVVATPGFASRIITGFAAMFVPRVLGESLGLIHVGGGRGLWLFAELDTLVLDLVLLYAIVHCVRSLRRRRAKMTATFVFCVLMFVMTAGPMLYTVSNFGTLFRLRLMVFCIAAIIPITLRDVTLRDDDAVQ
jgi:hypothetical protein